MPRIMQNNIIDVSVEKFLDPCTATELHEVEILMQRPRYRALMEGRNTRPKRSNDWYLQSDNTNNEEE